MAQKTVTQDIWELFDIPNTEQGGVGSYLTAILTRCSELFSAPVASVFVADRGGSIRCQAAIGTIISPNTTLSEGVGIAGTALLHGKAMLINDPATNPIIAPQVTTKRAELGSAMVVPLITNGRKLGVLNLARPVSAQPFNKSDLSKANTLAHHISLAVANWRLIEEIRSAHDQVEAIFELINVAVLVLENGKILKRNAEASRLFGTRSYQVLLDSIAPEFAETIDQCVERAQAGKPASDQRSDPTNSWLVNALPIPSGGVMLVVEDISTALKASQELSRVRRLAEIGQMTAAIAHEIRNPLTGIRSAAQMVQIAPDQAVLLAQMIEEEAIKLNDLCNQFLDFAKPVEPMVGTCDLFALANRIAAVHAAEFREAGVELEIIEHQPSIHAADKNQLEQVMLNLVMNAVQASHRGQKVWIEIDFSGFSVRDEGSGMDHATQQKLFAPFFTTKPKGTGLGLSNCQKIVEAHSGSINVESEPGKGSRFSVRLANHLSIAA